MISTSTAIPLSEQSNERYTNRSFAHLHPPLFTHFQSSYIHYKHQQSKQSRLSSAHHEAHHACSRRARRSRSRRPLRKQPNPPPLIQIPLTPSQNEDVKAVAHFPGAPPVVRDTTPAPFQALSILDDPDDDADDAQTERLRWCKQDITRCTSEGWLAVCTHPKDYGWDVWYCPCIRPKRKAAHCPGIDWRKVPPAPLIRPPKD